MTGAYLRVMRNGKWKSVEVEHLSDAEREAAIPYDNRTRWLHFVCETITKLEKEVVKLNASMTASLDASKNASTGK